MSDKTVIAEGYWAGIRAEPTTYGQKGGEGPNRGKRATDWTFMFPDGCRGTKKSFTCKPGDIAVAYVYNHNDKWYVASIDRPDKPGMMHYTQIPATPR